MGNTPTKETENLTNSSAKECRVADQPSSSSPSKDGEKSEQSIKLPTDQPNTDDETNSISSESSSTSTAESPIDQPIIEVSVTTPEEGSINSETNNVIRVYFTQLFSKFCDELDIDYEFDRPYLLHKRRAKKLLLKYVNDGTVINPANLIPSAKQLDDLSLYGDFEDFLLALIEALKPSINGATVDIAILAVLELIATVHPTVISAFRNKLVARKLVPNSTNARLFNAAINNICDIAEKACITLEESEDIDGWPKFSNSVHRWLEVINLATKDKAFRAKIAAKNDFFVFRKFMRTPEIRVPLLNLLLVMCTEDKNRNDIMRICPKNCINCLWMYCTWFSISDSNLSKIFVRLCSEYYQLLINEEQLIFPSGSTFLLIANLQQDAKERHGYDYTKTFNDLGGDSINQCASMRRFIKYFTFGCDSCRKLISYPYGRRCISCNSEDYCKNCFKEGDHKGDETVII